MELIESLTKQDADLGSTFICSKEVTINLDGGDLKNLLAYRGAFIEKHHYLTEEQIETMQGLLDILLEGVTNYDLV